MLACTDPAFDGPVILFQNVIKILDRSMSTLLFQNSAGFELNDGWRISGVLVGVDGPRRGMVLPPRLWSPLTERWTQVRRKGLCDHHAKYRRLLQRICNSNFKRSPLRLNLRNCMVFRILNMPLKLRR
jgi:hypothetical protein